MKLTFTNERLLAVVAHPDDTELLCSGTLARAKRDGAIIAISVLCRGDKGQPRQPIKNLSKVRRKEMTASAAALGAQLFAGEHSDGTLMDDNQSRRKLVEIFRKFKPSLVLAHAPEDYHPDHRAASALADAASWFCASHGYATKSSPLPSPPAIWWMDTLNMNGFDPGFYVDVSEFLSLKAQLLACHQSQLQRGKDPGFSPLAELMRLQFKTRGLQAGVEGAEAFRAHLGFKRTRAW